MGTAVSRAFVKEDDGEPARDLAVSREALRPITAPGLRALEARIAREDDAERRMALERIRAAVAVPEREATAGAAFGSLVTIRERDGRERGYRLVGEDEIDIAAGAVGIDSPLGAALLGARVGDDVIWERPLGPLPLTVVAIDAGRD